MMDWPLVFGVCENDLQRDQEFLQAFARGRGVDLKLTPLGGPTTDAKAARLLKRRVEAARTQGLQVRALLIHADSDTAGATVARRKVQAWARRHSFDLPVVVCAPDPCLERWLCRCAQLKGSSTPAAAPCQGWKKAWDRRTGIDLDRVRRAGQEASLHLGGLSDFAQFLADWDQHVSVVGRS